MNSRRANQNAKRLCGRSRVRRTCDRTRFSKRLSNSRRDEFDWSVKGLSDSCRGARALIADCASRLNPRRAGPLRRDPSCPVRIHRGA